MFGVICLAALVGGLIGTALIAIFYFKEKSLVLPYIVFIACMVVFAASAFLHITGVGKTADDPATQESNSAQSDSPAESNPTEESEPPEDSDPPSETASQAPNETSSPTTPAKTNALSVGDRASLGDWDISVTGFHFTDRIENSQYIYFRPDEGNQYAVVEVGITNNGAEMKTFLPPIAMGNDVYAKILYADKYEYSASVLLGLEKDLNNASLNPLTAKNGIIAFAVPESVVNNQDSLSITFFSGNSTVTFSLR